MPIPTRATAGRDLRRYATMKFPARHNHSYFGQIANVGQYNPYFTLDRLIGTKRFCASVLELNWPAAAED